MRRMTLGLLLAVAGFAVAQAPSRGSRLPELYRERKVIEAKIEALRAKFRRVNAEIVKLEESTGAWTNLIEMVDLEDHVVSGQWVEKGGSLAVWPARPACLELPLTPAPAYALRVRFARRTGHDPVSVGLPVGGGAACTLQLSRDRGLSHGIEFIGGAEAKPGKGNPTTVSPGKLINDRWYTVYVRVHPMKDDGVSIDVTLDGRPLVRWRGKRALLSRQLRGKRPARDRLTIEAYGVAAQFRTVEYRALPMPESQPVQAPRTQPSGQH